MKQTRLTITDGNLADHQNSITASPGGLLRVKD